MSRAFFVRTLHPPFEGEKCDRCGKVLSSFPAHWFNTARTERTRICNLCEECGQKWKKERAKAIFVRSLMCQPDEQATHLESIREETP